MDIMDSTTLLRLQSLASPKEGFVWVAALIFSPDSQRLTYFGHGSHKSRPYSPAYFEDLEALVVTWDLQTGDIVSSVEWTRLGDNALEEPFITYSMDGKVVAILSWLHSGGAIISVVDVVSGVHMHNLDCHQLDDSQFHNIWTHGESIRFVTLDSTGIALWEVGFAPGATYTKVETLSILADIDSIINFEFLHASNRAACAYTDQVLVWDARDTRMLLCHADTFHDPLMAFSSDGCFFACSTAESGIYLWKESSTHGYILHGNFSPSGKRPWPLFSPDGESIITVDPSVVQLWNTNNFTTTTTPSASVQLPQQNENFMVDFLPDRSLIVVARKRDATVVVLDLKSGVPKLTINTSMEVYGLGVNKNFIVAIGSKKVITWNLPVEDPLPDARLSVEDSAQIIHLGILDPHITAASVSLDFRYIALFDTPELGLLCIYNTSTGQLCANTFATLENTMWFDPDGDDIWCLIGGKRAEVWTITGGNLNYAGVVSDVEDGSWGCPWGPSLGHKITNDGWILGPDGKQLLMLLEPWQSDVVGQMWNGQFLALLHGTLPEPVIIELEI